MDKLNERLREVQDKYGEAVKEYNAVVAKRDVLEKQRSDLEVKVREKYGLDIEGLRDSIEIGKDKLGKLLDEAEGKLL